MIEIDKCPHCGEAAKLRGSWETSITGGKMQTWYVICTNPECEVRTMKYASQQTAVKVWNRRVQA